jgi:hypothetical protein
LTSELEDSRFDLIFDGLGLNQMRFTDIETLPVGDSLNSPTPTNLTAGIYRLVDNYTIRKPGCIAI